MKEDAERSCKRRLACATTNTGSAEVKAPAQDQWSEGPWAQLQKDFARPLPVTAQSTKCILVVVGPFGTWADVLPEIVLHIRKLPGQQ